MDSYSLLSHRSSEQQRGEEFEMQSASQSVPMSKSDYAALKIIEDGDGNSSKAESVKKKTQWATGIRLCACANVAVLLVNIVLTIVGASYGNKFSSVLVSMYQGNCSKTKDIATGLRILINILSTTLDVDYAHAHRVWLPIGTFNIKTLTLLPRHRKIMWYLLFGTSIAIQLIFNSAVYASTGANDFSVVAVPSSFATNDSKPLSDFHVPDSFESIVGQNVGSLRASAFNGTKFGKLTIEDFIKVYSVEIISNKRTLLLLSDELNSTTNNTSQSLSWAGSGFPVGTVHHDSSPHSWLSSGINQNHFTLAEEDRGVLVGNTTSSFPILVSQWPETGNADFRHSIKENEWPRGGFHRLKNITIESCLAENVPESCQLFINIPICVIVIVCNAIKLICMFLAAREHRDDVLVTIGDAIASFLQRPDPTTKNECMISKLMLNFGNGRQYGWKAHKPGKSWRPPPPRLPPPFRPHTPSTQPRHWAKTSNVRIWLLMCVFTSIAILIVFLFLVTTTKQVGLTSPFSVGLGAVNSATLLTNLSHNFVANILLANAVQLLVTGLYFLYNDMLTRMLLAVEYNEFALTRRTLRVSFPKGQQRSTYYLTIPYRYSVPALSTFTVIHWLVSEGFFFVQVLPYDIHQQPDPARTLNTCGYSPRGLLAALGLTLILAAIIVGMSYRKFKAPMMPLAMNCSAAISAACHPPGHDRHAAFKPVKWGEVQMGMMDLFGVDTSRIVNPFLHCSFTSKDVGPPREGYVYT